MAIGVNTYKGLGVPRYGESEMRQESSLDMLTLTHSTLAGGDFLVLRGNVPEGSTVTAQDVYSISSAGAIQGSVRPTIDITTADATTLTQQQSGSLIIVAANTDTSVAINLPVNPTPGTWYDFYLHGVDALGDFNIQTTVDSSAKISIVGLTSVVSTVDNITPLSTVPSGLHVVAVSSILWWARAEFSFAQAGTTDLTANDLILGLWGVGATA